MWEDIKYNNCMMCLDTYNTLHRRENHCFKALCNMDGGTGQQVRGQLWMVGVVKVQGKVLHSIWECGGLAPRKMLRL